MTNDEGRQTMKYLLAVDGSDQSLDAVRFFEALSPAESLKVLHVANVPGIPYPAMGANVAKDLAMTVERAVKEEGESLAFRRSTSCSGSGFDAGVRAVRAVRFRGLGSGF
jgi:hypothetical protein